MSKAFINKSHIEGWVYEHKLEVKTTGPNSKAPGTEFISGTISIATDNDCTNIVPVHFTYITEMTSKGKPDTRYAALKNVIDGVWKTVMANGKDSATKVRIDSAIGLNDFYTDRNGGEPELVSAKRNEGGFIHAADSVAEDEKVRNTFECDMIITSVVHVDADEDNDKPEKAIVKGCIFDFRKALLPVEFSAVNPNAIGYFEGLEATSKNPVFTKIWGRQVSEVVVKRIEEESAFGEAKVREVQSTKKDWVITGASAEPYAWDDEGTITVAELNEYMANRETYLAGVKKAWQDYKDSQGSSAGVPKGGFNF